MRVHTARAWQPSRLQWQSYEKKRRKSKPETFKNVKCCAAPGRRLPSTDTRAPPSARGRLLSDTRDLSKTTTDLTDLTDECPLCKCKNAVVIANCKLQPRSRLPAVNTAEARDFSTFIGKLSVNIFAVRKIVCIFAVFTALTLTYTSCTDDTPSDDSAADTKW